ncbi:ATP-binding protein [Schleiferiaceae bacterium]|nr:ATP-binding protein [Schleiferiaceae bacterium]
MIEKSVIEEILRVSDSGYLFHREGQELEFKEQFNFSSLADYFRDFSAFSNNKGGYLVFGVQDSPRIPNGLSTNALEQFEKIDSEKITGYLLNIFSGNIDWEQAVFKIDNKYFGVFRIYKASTKPIIAKKDEGKDQIIKSGEIYFRYGGRTQKIQFPELEAIINKRVEQNNNQWLDLMSKTGKAGPENAAILDTEKSVIEKENSKILVVDEKLASQLKFIREGEFVEKKGATTLKLVGNVTPIDHVEVVKKVKEDLIKQFPFSATQLASEIKKVIPSSSKQDVWRIIGENDLKNNFDYSAYNFRNKQQEDNYKVE